MHYKFDQVLFIYILFEHFKSLNLAVAKDFTWKDGIRRSFEVNIDQKKSFLNLKWSKVNVKRKQCFYMWQCSESLSQFFD